jgi:polyphosphate kinase
LPFIIFALAVTAKFKLHLQFINREISWLSFNERVLQEAQDTSVPLLERLRFLGIFSSNLDEFFRVRVATLQRMLPLGKKAKKIIGEHPRKVLDQIQQIVVKQQNAVEATYDQILKELENENIFIINEKQLTQLQGEFVKNYFHQEVRAALVPIIIDKVKDFPYLRDRAIYLAVKMTDSNGKAKTQFALIEVPTDTIPRFLVLPDSSEGKKYLIMLDDVIRHGLREIFFSFQHDTFQAYTIKLTRDAELNMDDDFAESYMEKITKGIKQRKKGKPVRFNYDETIDPQFLDYLLKRIHLQKGKDNVIPGARYHNFRDFINFPVMGKSNLTYRKMPALSHPDVSPNQSFLKLIGQKDVLLHYPYHSFENFIDLLREAAIDPNVISIKITLYRLARNSKVANALVNAVRNGKKVTAVMELQARFDEEHNIYWSERLRDEGAKVLFGVQGLKVHCKMCLITRKEKSKMKLYSAISTGNFNESSAKVYSDHMLFTSEKELTHEIDMMFSYFENSYKLYNYKHLAVSPFHMRKKFDKLIEFEVDEAKKGRKAAIFLKINNIVDSDMSQRIVDAANAGVKVRMIVRSTISVMPDQIKGHENIEIISIVGRFLEHSRIFIFHHGGKEQFYISSADWMTRNLSSRVEMATPVYDPHVQSLLRDFAELQWSDTVKARIINDKQDNQYRISANENKVDSQLQQYEYWKRYATAKNPIVTT